MRVFIAGGSGVIGRPTVRLLVERGHEVYALACGLDRARCLDALGARPLMGDVLDRERVLQWVRAIRPDAVVNAASSIPTGLRPRVTEWPPNDRVRREGTRHLTDAALAAGVGVFVHVSVALVHGDRGDQTVTEQTPLAPLPHLRSAVDAEYLVRLAAFRGLRTVVLRPGRLYGPDAWHTLELVRAVAAGRPVVIGSGDYFWSNVHAEDCALALALAVERAPAGEVFLVADDEPLRFREVVALMAQGLGVPPPGGVPTLVARLVLGRDAVRAFTMSQRLANARIKERLGWQPAYPTVRQGFATLPPPPPPEPAVRL